MMKIFLNDIIHPDGVKKLLDSGAEIISDFNRVDEAEGMIVRGVVADRALLEKAKNLKVVGKHGVGYNTIDIEAAKELGIQVVYTPGMNSQGVAELIVGLMLDVSRRISRTYYHIENPSPDNDGKVRYTGTELFGKTVAFVGLGNVSLRAADILVNGFQMKALGYDIFAKESSFSEHSVVRYDNMYEMLKKADYVSVSVPLTDQTRGMIGEKELHCMKPSSILINTARGGIVDEDALYKALTEGWIRGAGFDVFVQEPPTKENKLFSLDNFIGTPHVGGNTEESIYRCTDTVVEEVLSVVEGKEARFRVV